MSRQDANAAFALSSFLQGTNAAYIEQLYARYQDDPNSVTPEWRQFFAALATVLPEDAANVYITLTARSLLSGRFPMIDPGSSLKLALLRTWIGTSNFLPNSIERLCMTPAPRLASSSISS